MNSSYFNTAAGAFLGVVFVMMTVSIVSEGIYHSEAPEQEGFAIVADESAGAASGEAAGGEEEMTPIATLLASADPAAGEASFKKCAACHTIDPSGTNKVGPGLYGAVGRPVAGHEGFNYSAALKEYATEVPEWDYEALNRFLLAPKKEVPGTAMGFAGLKKDDERANVIAYMREQADSPAPLPSPAEAAEGGEEAAPTDQVAPTEGAVPPQTEGDAATEEAIPSQADTTAPSAEDNTGTAADDQPAGDGEPNESQSEAPISDKGESTGR